MVLAETTVNIGGSERTELAAQRHHSTSLGSDTHVSFLHRHRTYAFRPASYLLYAIYLQPSQPWRVTTGCYGSGLTLLAYKID